MRGGLGTELPIDESDAFIAEALENAKIIPLIMSIIHLTGDASLMEEVGLSAFTIQNLDGDISDEDKRKVRKRALEALVAYRDGRPMAAAPSEGVIKQMIDFIASREVTADYAAMLLSDMAPGETEEFHWSDDVRPQAAADFQTLVIGAGMSGLLQGYHLSKAGLPFMIIEKNDEVGGTWYGNRYPGCRVDSSNYFYSYSFEPNNEWSSYYCERDELLAYFQRCADRFDLRRHIRFNTEVVEARFDQRDDLWHVMLRKQDGSLETVRANAIVSAVGQLNRARIPDFLGRERFQGPAFHSAEWESEHQLEGKRIAVIGAGATAFQLIPEVAKIASHLICFQRSPGWMAPNPGYHSKVESGTHWLLKHVPYYQQWYRYCLFWSAADGTLPGYTMDPAWNDKDRSINAFNARQREIFSSAIEAQLGDRKDIAEKVIPPYPVGGKRLLQDNGHYLRALMRDNVEMAADGIREIVEDGIVDNHGRHHQVDVILYATGFHANKFLFPMKIIGRTGTVLSELWGDTPRAYLGITVPDFPNLFCLYGPGTNLAHGGSIIFHSECQVHYVMECLKILVESGISTMEVHREAFDGYVSRLEEALSRMVWSHSGVTSWYKNAHGIVVNTSPWRLVDYWTWTRGPDLADYQLSKELEAA